MKKNKFTLMLSFLFLIFFGINKVEAATVSCYYDFCSDPMNSRGFIIEYNSDTGQISTKYDNKTPYCHVNADKFTASTFIKDGKLICPTVYYAGGSGARGSGFQIFSEKNESLIDEGYHPILSEKKHIASKSKIPDVNLSTKLVCTYSYDLYNEYYNSHDKFELTITVDTKEKKIIGYSIPGREVGGSINYDEIIKNAKCVSKDKISVVCDTLDGKKCAVFINDNPEEEPKDEYIDGAPVTGCEVIPESIRKWINNILKIVRYVALAITVALGTLDFMKAAASGEPDSMKKAGQSFIKRLIAVIILFLLPLIVDFILNMVNIYGVDPNNINCMNTTSGT